jgi:hypothetical protein
LRFWHFTTWPNVPWPKTSKIKYRFLSCRFSLLRPCREGLEVTHLCPASSEPRMSLTYRM